MSATWEAIYRNYTDDELADEREKLKKHLDNMYLSQSTGNKSYQRDLGMIQGRMKAVTSVQNERGIGGGGAGGGAGGAGLKGQVNFGETCLDDF